MFGLYTDAFITFYHIPSLCGLINRPINATCMEYVHVLLGRPFDGWELIYRFSVLRM